MLCGACDGFPELPAPDYPFAHEAWLAHARSDAAIPNLALAVRPDPGEHLETYRRLVRVFHEIRFLGMHPSDHPMRVLREEAARAGCVTSAQIESALGRTVTFAGIVSAQRRLAVRAGVVQFVTFEDEEGMLEAVLPPHSYARLGDPIRNPGPFLLTGRVEGESGDARLMIARALPFHSRPRPYATQSAS